MKCQGQRFTEKPPGTQTNLIGYIFFLLFIYLISFFLKNVRNLKRVNSKEYRRMILVQDLSTEEWREDKKLREELK